jgi:hypothetical protein
VTTDLRRLSAPVVALALVVAGCGSMTSETDGIATTSSSPGTGPAAIVSPMPRLTPVPILPPKRAATPPPVPRYLASNASDFRDGLLDNQGFTCPDVDGAGQLLWTCSLAGEATISFYGPGPGEVHAIRVETPPSDPGDWMRGYASIVSTDVHAWVADRVGADAVGNETEQVGGVWVQTTHDARSDVLLMSTEPLDP